MDKKKFEHRALDLNERTKIIFIAMTKHVFYFRRHAVKYVLESGFTPISQYGIFDYFVTDTVERDFVRRANNNLLNVSDEMWVFGPVSDGVLAEIKLARQGGKPLRYFKIVDSKQVTEIQPDEVDLEADVSAYRNLL